MLDKLLKGLGGLGGTAALVTGGVYLKNYLDEVNEIKRQEAERERKILERKNFITESDEKANELERGASGSDILLRSDTNNDLWEITWILESLSETNKTLNGGGYAYSKDEMEKIEKKYWEEKIMKGIAMKLPEGEIEKINEDYKDSPYWEKYKEACMKWNITRTREQFNSSGSLNACIAAEKWETYKEGVEYKTYLEVKKQRPDLAIREFFWTIWKKFKDEKGLMNSSSNIKEEFEKWKIEDKNKHLFSEGN